MAITTDINYPDGLPWPVRDGYDINHVQPFRRTTLASGRARQRKKFTSVPSMFNVTWIFDGDTQVAAFEAWFRDAISDGADWFNSRLKTPIGEGQYVCRFTEMYRGPTLVGLCAWRVSAVLELWERPLMPSGWGLMPEYLLGADIFDVTMNAKWPEA